MKINAILIIIQFFIISIILFMGIFHKFNYNEYEIEIIKRNNESQIKQWTIFFIVIMALLFLIGFLIKLKKSKNKIFAFIIFSLFTIYNHLILVFIADIRIFVGFKLQIILFSIVAFTGLISTIYLIYKFWNNNSIKIIIKNY